MTSGAVLQVLFSIQTLVSNVYLFSRSEVKIICSALKTKVKCEINLQDFTKCLEVHLTN